MSHNSIKGTKEAKEKHTNKRNPAQIAADGVIVEKLTLEGYGIREITQHINSIRNYKLTHTVLFQQLVQIKAQWREEAKELIDDRVARMLKRFDKMRRELTAAWERSQKEFKSIEKTQSDDGCSIKRKKEQRDGQVAFLSAMQDLDRQERELLGMDKPKKTALTDIDGKESYTPLVIAGLTEADMPKKRKDNKE